MNENDEIEFYRTLRLTHNDKEFLSMITNCKNVLYSKSQKVIADKNNLYLKLKESAERLLKDNECYMNNDWCGTRFINIEFKKKNNEIVKIEKNDRQKINKFINNSEFSFIEEKDPFEDIITKINKRKKKDDKTSDEIDKRYNTLIQSGRGLKKI